MHELSIMVHVVEIVEETARENNVAQIDTLVLQIGEMASVVPQFIRACYPAVIEGTMLENAKLEIEILPANALCKGCGKVYNLMENKGVCPHCQSEDYEMLTGREFNIKEIVAY